MSIILSSLLFLACPIPPEQAQTQHQNNQNQKNSQQAGIQNPPQNQEPKKEGQTGEVKGENGEAKAGEPNMEEGNLDAGNEEDIKDGQVKQPDETTQPPPITQEASQQDKPEMVTDSLLIRVDRIPPKPILPQKSQEDLVNEKHYTFSGTIVCDDCSATLILRAVPFINPNEPNTTTNLVTEKEVQVGSFSLLLPNAETAVVLELLVDKDKNGSPSAGEYFAVIDMGGTLIPTRNHKDLVLNATKRDFFEPAPPPGTQAPE